MSHVLVLLYCQPCYPQEQFVRSGTQSYRTPSLATISKYRLMWLSCTGSTAGDVGAMPNVLTMCDRAPRCCCSSWSAFHAFCLIPHLRVRRPVPLVLFRLSNATPSLPQPHSFWPPSPEKLVWDFLVLWPHFEHPLGHHSINNICGFRFESSLYYSYSNQFADTSISKGQVRSPICQVTLPFKYRCRHSYA